MARVMMEAARPAVWLVSTLGAAALFWTGLFACLDAPVTRGPPQIRAIATWDPLACGDPHRVVVELADDAGVVTTGSVPCELGGLAVVLPHFGAYRGRVFASVRGAPIRTIAPVELDVSDEVVRWTVESP